jgi:plastocyanin
MHTPTMSPATAHRDLPLTLVRLTAALTAACASALATAAPQTLVLLDAKGQPVAQAVLTVMVKGTRTTAAPGISAEMAQKNKHFRPDLLVVQTGTSVRFPNLDTVRHHVYSFSPTKTFEIKLYAGTPSTPVVFDKPGTATLGCNIHDQMLGYIHVVDSPYFGITDERGQLTVDIPAGEHRLRVWTAAMGESQPDIELPLRTSDAPVMVRLPN